jgi:trimeric autotransporter adhesin
MPLTKAKTDIIDLNKDTTINTINIGLGGGQQASSCRVGQGALSSNTAGVANTAIGNGALFLNTQGSNNTAIGNSALGSNSTGPENTAIGSAALSINTIGTLNTAVGFAALAENTSSNQNTAIGSAALSQANSFRNTALGSYSLFNTTSGSENTGLGVNSLFSNTTGTQNTAVGHGSLNIAASNNNSSGLGYDSQVTGSNQIQLGNSATTTYVYGTVQNRSDERDKTEIKDTELGLEFVKALRPVDFKWDMREDYRPEAPSIVIKPADLKDDATEEEKAKYDQDLAAYNAYVVAKDKWLEDVKLANITHDGSKKRNRYHHGLIAQEVKAVLDEKGIDFGGFQDHKIAGGDDVLSIGYDELIGPMIKAIQELSAKVAELEAK